MHHPFQCIEVLPALHGDVAPRLLAASGPKLFCVNLADGAILSQWSGKQDEPSPATQEPGESEGRPVKKQKIAAEPAEPANIIIVKADPQQQYVHVVTAEDKKIHVLELCSTGELKSLSERCMPKKPCALELSPDGSTIYAGDKFGDLYALPNLGRQGDRPAPPPSAAPVAARIKAPSATDKTVHSRANLRALQEQLKLAEKGGSVKTKEPLDFEHRLALGHVSMLTDVLCASSPGQQETDRFYLITSDRDEHIRVSRGGEQSYVIENFCLGHEEFVSKLCLVGDRLYSGGGDDDVHVWNWVQGKLLSRIPLKPLLPSNLPLVERNGHGSTDKTSQRQIAVTGLCAYYTAEQSQPLGMVVISEGVPGFFDVQLSEDSRVSYVPLAGNALDVAYSNGNLIVSIDNIHEPGTTTTVNADESFRPRLIALSHIANESGEWSWQENDHLTHVLADLNQQTTVSWHEKALQSLLYNTEQLRKRDGGDNDEN